MTENDETTTIKCKKYNSWGECVEWIEEGDQLVGRVNPLAEKCSPKLAAEAKENLKEGRVKVRLS